MIGASLSEPHTSGLVWYMYTLYYGMYTLFSVCRLVLIQRKQPSIITLCLWRWRTLAIAELCSNRFQQINGDERETEFTVHRRLLRYIWNSHSCSNRFPMSPWNESEH